MLARQQFTRLQYTDLSKYDLKGKRRGHQAVQRESMRQEYECTIGLTDQRGVGGTGF